MSSSPSIDGGETAVILLAAGGSQRMGQPKQLLEWEGQPLVAAIIRRILPVNPAFFAVVVGAFGDQVAEACAPFEVEIVRNSEWESGLSTSLQKGIHTIRSLDRCVGRVLIALADQPHITTDHFHSLLQKSTQHPQKIITSNYQNIQGVPMVFPRSYWGELSRVSGDNGAGKWVRSRPELTETVYLGAEGKDWDSPLDVPVHGDVFMR